MPKHQILALPELLHGFGGRDRQTQNVKKLKKSLTLEATLGEEGLYSSLIHKNEQIIVIFFDKFETDENKLYTMGH